jgi:hypothetical protein
MEWADDTPVTGLPISEVRSEVRTIRIYRPKEARLVPEDGDFLSAPGSRHDLPWADIRTQSHCEPTRWKWRKFIVVQNRTLLGEALTETQWVGTGWLMAPTPATKYRATSYQIRLLIPNP